MSSRLSRSRHILKQILSLKMSKIKNIANSNLPSAKEIAQNARHWLMKAEPSDVSIDDLKRESVDLWTGVRNHQAKLFMKDYMKVGDKVLFYQSNTVPPGVVGIARVSKQAIADPTQFVKSDPYYDAKATKFKPIWYCVEVEFVAKIPQMITLDRLRSQSALSEMLVLRRGQRLSVQPVAAKHFDFIVNLAGIDAKTLDEVVDLTSAEPAKKRAKKSE